MLKFHYNTVNGSVSQCRSLHGRCPFKEEFHCDSENLKIAQDYYESYCKKENTVFNNNVKKVTPLDVFSSVKSGSSSDKLSVTPNVMGGRKKSVGVNSLGSSGVANFKFGQDRTSKNQLKKHYSQLSKDDVDKIINKFKGDKNIRYSNHVRKKVRDENLKIDDVLIRETLRNLESKNIIEYNSNVYADGSVNNRVLIRSSKAVEVYSSYSNSMESCNICFSIDENHNIVTVYWNRANDSHRSVDYSKYSKDLDVSFS